VKQFIAKIMLSTLAIVALGACRSPAADPPSSAIRHVIVIRPTRGVVERTLTLPGDLVGYYQTALYAKVTGYLKSISVDKGDWVRSGQVLAEIEVPELEQQIARARADLEIQELTYQRLQSVWKSDPRLIARQDVDIASGKYQEAKANVDELLAMDSYTHITAPFSGVITERFVDPGALIHADGQRGEIGSLQGVIRPGGSAAPVVSIARLDKLRIYVYVPQSEADSVYQGMPAIVTGQGLAGARFSGTVVRFSHSLDLATRTMLTEVDLDNPDHKLYPGMYADVTLTLQRHINALRIPAAAIGGNEAHQVFVVRHDRLVELPVTTGINDGRHVEISNGLNANDLVVRPFSDSLIPGETVTFDVAGAGKSSLALAH
jgi:membrane fusion protein (multidrug efflux system)